MALLGFTIVRVDGVSMGSVLPHRTLALFRRRRRVTKGDIVLVEHPEFGTIVKCVAEVSKTGSYLLRGTSPASTSQKRLGSVEGEHIKGVLVFRIA